MSHCFPQTIMAWIVSFPHKRYVEILTSSASECDLTEAIRLNWGHWDGYLTQYTGVLIKTGNLATDISRRSAKWRWRQRWLMGLQAKGHRRSPAPPEAGEQRAPDSPSRLRRNQPVDTCSETSASRTETIHSYCSSHPGHGALFQSPQRRNTEPQVACFMLLFHWVL